jgi:hypothetical protein
MWRPYLNIVYFLKDKILKKLNYPGLEPTNFEFHTEYLNTAKFWLFKNNANNVSTRSNNKIWARNKIKKMLPSVKIQNGGQIQDGGEIVFFNF